MAATAPRPYRLFLDSAEPAVWRKLLPTGIFHGVTTNPLLLRKAHLSCNRATLTDLAGQARDAGAREIHLQAWGEEADQLVERGLALAAATAEIDIAVKIPATPTGLAAAKRLVDDGCRVTLTAVYSPGQVLAAAALGVAYAAPYLGRLNDAGLDGHAVLRTMGSMLAGRDTSVRLLAASLRRVKDIIDLAAAGLDTFTFSPEVALALLQEPLTEQAAAAFELAAKGTEEES
ncbi:transaldolase [bacterium]|nr:MAG: transaldolase [bacterium]